MPLPNGFEKPILGTFVGPDNIDANLNNVPKQIVRLTDFISVWNLLNKIKYYYCVRESGIFLNQTIATDIVDESFNLKTEYSYGEKYLFPHQNGERPAYQHANLRKSLRRGRYRVAWIPRIEWINQKYVGKSSHALIGWFMSDFPHSHSFFIPVDVKKIPIDAQSYFIKMNEKTIKWHRGQFNKTFHELYKVTLDRTSLTLGDLISDLIIQAEKSQDSVQLFGAKVARSAITSWGIAIICLVQLYFLLHIRTLRALNIFIGNIPWIMGYRDKLSQSVSIISIVLLPIIVVITLCFEGITLSEDHLIILAIATLGFLGVFLSFWTLKVFISLRRVMGLSKGDNMDNKEMIVEGGNETLGDVGKKETF